MYTCQLLWIMVVLEICHCEEKTHSYRWWSSCWPRAVGQTGKKKQNSLPVDNELLVPSLVVCCRWPKVLQHLLDFALSQNVEFHPFRVNSCLMWTNLTVTCFFIKWVDTHPLLRFLFLSKFSGTCLGPFWICLIFVWNHPARCVQPLVGYWGPRSINLLQATGFQNQFLEVEG